MGQKERDNTKAEAASAKVVPLWSASNRDDLPTGYLQQVARRVRANLTDLVATADTYNLGWRPSSGLPRSCSSRLRALATPCRSQDPPA